MNIWNEVEKIPWQMSPWIINIPTIEQVDFAFSYGGA